MFIYFDRNGVLQEVINDKAARLGDLNANEIYVYVDEVALDDIWLTLKRPDGTLSVEKSFIANKVVREIPYDPKRDMKFFKDFKEYEFYKFTITDEITIAGVYQATIRMTYEDTLSALGVLVFKAETGVIKSDQNITQAQYDYLIWYVGSWQGQIGDLEDAMGIAKADILALQNRMNVAESDINKIEDGTTVVKKALKDDLGNTIKSTYANKLDLVYSSSNNRIAITLKSYDGTPIDADLIDLPKATTSADGLLAKEDKVKINNIATDIASMGATKQSLSEKNQINGYAGLDNNAKIPSSLLPDSVLGQLEYKGTFNPNSGYPVSPEKGWYYIAIANALIGGVDYQVGDWAVYNGSTWDKIDNTDAVMSVNGKLGVVVLNGTEIQVGNGDTWTIEQRIVNIYAELNNRYTKAQTYSNAEIEQRITDLLGMMNLQDTAIEKSAGVFTFDNGDSLLASSLSQYNWVITRFYTADGVRYNLFKPSEATSGNRNIVQIVRSPVRYAEIKRDNDNILFRVVDASDVFDSNYVCTMKMWGIKLDGIDASDISYNNETVESALDSLLVPEYITATHEALQTEITATNSFEINDETGDVIKITGNEPANLLTGTDNITSTTPFSASNSVNTVADGNLINTGNGGSAIPYPVIYNLPFAPNSKVYVTVRGRVTNSVCDYIKFFGYEAVTGEHSFSSEGSGIYNPVANQWYTMSNVIDTPANTLSARFYHGYADAATANGKVLQLDYIKAYDVSDMIKKGIKNDAGIPFANLTNGEIKSQLDIWVENGFPTVVEKLISKSDNLFNAKFNTLSSLESENIVVNSDLTLDSNSDGVPDGFSYGGNTTNKTLNNGVATFTATATWGRLNTNLSLNVNDIIYYYANFKASSPLVSLAGITNTSKGHAYHSGSGNFEFKSNVQTADGTFNSVQITDNRTADFTPIEVDYIGVINITDLVSRGILPSGLTNNEYKEMIDKAMFNNVPLRETDYIAVEPSKAYKLIKVSANEVTHKVIEYTTDNQVVKVTPVVYTTNKFIFTTNALTSKIKIVSDLLERPDNLVVNGDLTLDSDSNGIPDGFTYGGSTTNRTLVDGVATFTATAQYGRLLQDIPFNVNDLIYYYARVKASSNLVYLTGVANFTSSNAYHSGNNEFEFLSNIQVASGSFNVIQITDSRTSGWTPIEVDYVGAFNVSDMKLKGVKNDSGTLFSRLTNDEIKDQMDIWVKNGFPDHVIAALYPNGVDTAIALKYNDADDVFRPQQIDELPLNLTLRSGEYWQDGYVVKQNGNAEYYPLDTKFSAWNYGQLEAVYTSGVPADFDIQYAQNTAAQVKTTQEFLVEAREQIDYVTEGYDNLVEKLGDAIFSDKYDSYAGITSDTYEYYTLEGVKEGNTLAIEGAGQSIQNLLGKGGTIIATSTTRGITVTYDPLTGVFTANGTATAGKPFNITLATGMDFDLPVGTPMQLMRYYDGGTVDLNGSYIGYVLVGTSASNRINENSEALYDPYINGSGNLKPNHATDKQYLVFQVWAPGITFTNFKFKIGIYEGLQLRPFILPSGETAKSNVTVYNRTANMLDMPTALNIEDSGITITYDPLVQEFLLSGTATATKDISLNATFNVLSGDRFSIKRLYQSGDVTAAGGTLPRLKLVNSTNTTIVYNDIYKMTAPEGETLTPDVTFNTGTAPADATLTLKLGITNGQVFDNYRFRLMIHDKSTDIGYVAYRRELLGNMSIGANERAVIEFKAIPYGILEFVAAADSLNLLFADSITDLNKTYLEYNAGIISPNRKISELTARAELIDNPFRNKVIAVWGDSRESNNPTSDPSGVGDQKDTSWPALLAKKLNATVLNYGLSGGAWAENTVQQDAASAIVNRVQTEDVSASADVIIISSMNDFKLASPLGSPLPNNKDKTTFYGAMRLTYERLATKYPGKKIVLVLPQKRYDETVNYGGGSYYHYLKAQVEVANEYGIPVVDLYNNMPGVKGTAFYNTYMLNDTHWSAVGNDRVAELVARELIGNGNKGNMDRIPPIPTTDGTYTLKVTITGGIPVFSWVANE